MSNKSAENTDFLSTRITQNEKHQSIDINVWAFEKIGGNKQKLNILELCCGTGKQTEYLSNNFPESNITCVDVSKDAIAAIGNKFADKKNRVKAIVSGIDEFFANNNQNFDMIFCSYGLYYATDIDSVLIKLYGSLNENGRFVVMGPYGNNNKQLFDLVLKSEVKIPPFVTYSSCDFMHSKVIYSGIMNTHKIEIFSTTNSIKWNAPEDVVSYWKNSTFYDAAKESLFRELLDGEMKNSQAFINDKHIMLVIITK